MTSEVPRTPAPAEGRTAAPPAISAVLPAYNEAENLPGLINELAAVLESLGGDYEIIVVDDGSADATPQVVAELQQSIPQIRHVRHRRNQGYGAALASGFQAAAKDLIFLTDGDHQFDVTEIRRLLDARTADDDFVIGYRAPRRDPFMRRLNAWGWNRLVRVLFGYTARDVDCAFKLLPRRAVEDIMPRSRGAAFSAELLAWARKLGFHIVEVPVTHQPRRAGRATGAKLSVILRAFLEIVGVWWRVRRKQIPVLDD